MEAIVGLVVVLAALYHEFATWIGWIDSSVDIEVHP